MSPAVDHQAAEQGFSLIEVMAALAILALAGLAVVNMVSVTTRNTTAVETRALGMVAAENLLNMELLRPGRITGRSGDYELAGVGYSWELDVEATTDRELVRLVMTVREGESGYLAGRIETFRRRP
ncbi:type II secretion system minor pseudopilin GspI [Maricaulis sp.]|uniref:type II secretion system minor pseudopilin GspI n=1 Tax=Maricaulis sp. TaxID=1486257 RepID=UPI002631210B|nr:type II secretion system minor pseudopilin GspI [Maricaulis sp.]